MNEFIYQKLKRLDGYWRVDGVGGIRNSGAYGVSCDVRFQRLLPQYVENDTEDLSRNHAGMGIVHPLTVHVATLSRFKVGTVWVHGKFHRGAPSLKQGLNVDLRHCQYVRLGEAITLGEHTLGTILSERNYKFSDNRVPLKDSFYAVAPVVNNVHTKWIVIPVCELLRFYYGPSSPMLTSVVRGKLDDYVSLDRRESYLEGTNLVLRNRQRLTKLEALTLGRLIASSTAMSEARHIHKHLGAQSANRANRAGPPPAALTLHARFPFNDKTMLTVCGKRIKLIEGKGGKEDQWGVFAMEIVTCSHTLGFDELTQVRHKTAPAASGTGIGKLGRPSALQPTNDEYDELETTDAPPNTGLPRLAERTIVRPFTAASRIKFHYERAGAGRMGTLPGQVDEIAVKALSMGEGTNAQSSRNILGTDTYQYELNHTSRDLGIFLKMLTHLQEQKKKDGWTIRTKQLSTSIRFGDEYLASFPSDIGPRRSSHLIQNGKTTRPRHIALVEICFRNGGKCYLLEMEVKRADDHQCTLFLHSKRFEEISESDFETLFKLTAIQRRWISNESIWKEDQETEREDAANFLATHTTYRFLHPHAKPESEEENAPRVINPKHWAEELIKKMDEKLPQSEPEHGQHISAPADQI